MRLEISQQQRLTISPVIMQKLELLTVPAIELTERLEKEIEQNPVLELEYTDKKNTNESENEAADESELNFSDSSDLGMNKTFKRDKIIRDYNNKIYIENFSDHAVSLIDFLTEQIHFLKFSDKELSIAERIITALDDRGFLSVDLQKLIEDIDVSLKEAEEVRQVVMHLDPLGIASKDLREYLLIQAKEKFGETSLEYIILNEHSNLLEKKLFTKIAQKINSKNPDLKITYKKVETAVRNISHLNIVPIGNLSPNTVKYIVPDAIVEIDNDEIKINLIDDYIPNIRISSEYENWYQTKQKDENKPLDKKTLNFLKENIDKANLLIENLQSRKEIIFKVILQIVQKQKDFFLKGDQHQIPLKLKDIADELNIHESTVSRAIKDKYIQTDKGIISLKQFFSSNVGNDDTSSNSVKAMLKRIIDAEDKNDPLTDDKLARILTNKGINISRRTIAKYRNALKIPPANLRRNPH